MARSSDDVSDASPLASPHVDQDVRAGWLVRTSRLHHVGGPVLLGDLAETVAVTAGTVSRWETGRSYLRPTHLERLETGLGVPAGTLRGPVALLRRYFGEPTQRRAPLRAVAAEPDVAGTSDLVRAVFEGGASGIDWMHLADAVDEGRLLVPLPVLEPVLASLVSEHVRSVVRAYFCREDTVVRLVKGPYGTRLQQVLVETATAADTQVSVDSLAAAGHRPTPELFTVMCALLLDDRDQVFRGAAWSIETMFRQRVLAVPPLLPVLEAALRALPPQRRASGFELLDSLPSGVRRTLGPSLGAPTAPRGLAVLAAAAQRAVARDVGRRVAAALDTSRDPMLERLVIEALFDPYWSKRLSARMLLMATPYASLVGDCVARAVAGVADVEDDPLGAGALDFVLEVGSPEGLAVATTWARDDRASTKERGLVALAHFGHDLDPGLLEAALRVGGTTTERALYAAGMTGSPLLRGWAEQHPPGSVVARGAAWWLRHGPRVGD